jgi:hypothetical protein
MLMVMTGASLAAPTAGAAEIPPTAECTAVVKDTFKGYSPERYQKLTKKQKEAVDRHMVNRLFEADCVSAVEPILTEMPTKPFSQDCKAGAKGADEYWSSIGPTVVPLIKAGRKATKPVRVRKQIVIKRIRTLRKAGASAKRLAPLVRLRKVLAKREARIGRPYIRELFKAYRTFGFNSFLIVAELMSLRCIPKESNYGSKPKGPAAKVLKKHALTVFFLVLMVMYEEDDITVSASSGDSSVASASSADRFKHPQLPLISLP